MYQSMEEYIQNPSNWTPDLEDGYHITVGRCGNLEARFFYCPMDEELFAFGLELVSPEGELIINEEKYGSIERAFLWFEKALPQVDQLMKHLLLLKSK